MVEKADARVEVWVRSVRLTARRFALCHCERVVKRKTKYLEYIVVGVELDPDCLNRFQLPGLWPKERAAPCEFSHR